MYYCIIDCIALDCTYNVQKDNTAFLLFSCRSYLDVARSPDTCININPNNETTYLGTYSIRCAKTVN